MNYPAGHQLPIGGRILNNKPMESTLISGRSARPGDAPFDQNFGQTQNTFARATTYVENQDTFKQPRNAHFEYAGTTSNALAGGAGATKDATGAGFANMAMLA